MFGPAAVLQPFAESKLLADHRHHLPAARSSDGEFLHLRWPPCPHQVSGHLRPYLLVHRHELAGLVAGVLRQANLGLLLERDGSCEGGTAWDRVLGFALRARWLWLQKKREGCWNGLQIQVEPEVEALFDASVRIVVGDGRLALFWHWQDAWLDGRTVKHLTPALFAAVDKNAMKI